MNAETLAWTLVFFGGDLCVVVALIAFAVKKDREKGGAGNPTGEQTS